MQNDFEGKSILITGAASGMGRAEAVALARQGAKVWIADVSTAAGATTVDEIRAAGGEARFHKLDVTDFDAWKELEGTVSYEDGKLDGLVNNAGISHRFGIVDTDIADWQRVMDINLSSVFFGMKAMAPLMMQTGGSIVNISSIAEMVGYFAAGYGASKWGVRGLSKTGSLEFAKDDIRVNSVHPGLVETPLLNSGSAEFVEQSMQSVPAGRLASAEEVAETVMFLLSDKSRYITGTEMVIDGGMTSGGLYHRVMSDLAKSEQQA